MNQKLSSFMKKTILFLLIFFVVTSVVSQNQKVVVHLTNGSVVKGKVIELWSPDNVKIESNNIVWVFHESEVDTIIVKGTKKVFEIPEKPFNFKVEYGVQLGNSENEEDVISFFHTFLNYRLVKNYYLGAGVGIEYYMEQSYIPVFANFEYKFRQTRFSPLIFLKTGYLLPGEKQHTSELYEQYESRNLPPKYLNASGGGFINPGFGFTSMVGDNFGFYFTIGYRHHSLNFKGKEKYELEQRYNRLCLSLGITFK